MEKKGLQVINASYSKTGTKTMHEAFDILGYKVCDAHENVYRFDLDVNYWTVLILIISVITMFGRRFGMPKVTCENTFIHFMVSL